MSEQNEPAAEVDIGDLTPAQAAKVRAAAYWYRKEAVRHGVVVGLLVGATAAFIFLWLGHAVGCP